MASRSSELALMLPCIWSDLQATHVTLCARRWEAWTIMCCSSRWVWQLQQLLGCVYVSECFAN